MKFPLFDKRIVDNTFMPIFGRNYEKWQRNMLMMPPIFTVTSSARSYWACFPTAASRIEDCKCLRVWFWYSIPYSGLNWSSSWIYWGEIETNTLISSYTGLIFVRALSITRQLLEHQVIASAQITSSHIDVGSFCEAFSFKIYLLQKTSAVAAATS